MLTAVAPSFELGAVTSANSQPVVLVDMSGPAEGTPVEGLSVHHPKKKKKKKKTRKKKKTIRNSVHDSQ